MSTILTFRINVLQNGSAINLLLSRQAGVLVFDIHRQLVDVLETEIIAYSTVTRYLRESLWTARKTERTERETQDVVAQAILATLEELPFSSVRELSKRTCTSSTIVYRRLTNSMGFVLKHLRWSFTN
jgi:hypothetical protein